MRVNRIKDPRDNRVEIYRSLKGKELEHRGVFIAEGDKVLRCLLSSGHKVESCLVSAEAVSRYRPLVSALARRGARIYSADRSLIEGIIGFRFHRGIMAAGLSPDKARAAAAIKNIETPSVFVALDSVNDPQNVGLITRSAAAFGVRAMLVDSSSYDPYYRKSVRVSMGTIFSMPVYYEEDIAETLKWLKRVHKVRVIAASCDRRAISISRAKLSGKVCLVFGNEDKGVSKRILSLADGKARIPISGGVDSLNVSNAAAVFMYEVEKSQKKGESGSTGPRR